MQLNWLNAHYDALQGFGYHGLQMLRALQRRDVKVKPLSMEACEWPGWLQRQAGMDFGGITIIQAKPPVWPDIPGRIWGFSMYEATALPPSWARIVNARAERMLVPSEWLVGVFRDNGIHVPIHVIPEGIDPASFPAFRRVPNGNPYNFLTFAGRGLRKGWDLAWWAFYEEFQNDEAVTLTVKGRRHDLAHLSQARSDSRVRLWREDSAVMADVYATADCFVFPTRGEGWGLPGREAAATGCPVIVTDWGGTADGLPHYGIPLNANLAPSWMEAGGQWAEPDVDHLRQLMRWCFENRDEAADRGMQAAEWLRANQTWDHAVDALMDLLEHYA